MKNVLLTILVILTLLLLSCDSDSTSSSEKYTLSGNVKLLDLDGNEVLEGLSNVSIMIYDLVEIDSGLLQVKADYPFIGSDVNQEVFFDIRDKSPIKEINCDDNGNFTSKIAKGTYNIVVYSEDYGYKMFYDYNLDSDSSINDINLYEIQELSGAVSNFTFQADHVYHITDDLVIQENSNVVLQAGAYIDVADNSKIYVNDDFNITENNGKNVNFNSIYYKNQEKNLFSGIEIMSGENINIYSLIVKNASNALLFSNQLAITQVTNSSFINNNRGIITQNIISVNISECNIFNNTSIGCEIDSQNSLNNNIVYNNNEGVRVVEAISDLSNSYYLDNWMGIRCAFYEEVNIHNNEFDKNEFGISMSGSNPAINFNNFKDDFINIELCARYTQASYDYCLPNIENNNILSVSWQIGIKGFNDLFAQNNQAWAVNTDFYCGKNFFGKTKNFLDNKIYMFNEGFYVVIDNEFDTFLNTCGIFK